MFSRKSAIFTPGVQVLINSKKMSLKLNKPHYTCMQSNSDFSSTPRLSSDNEKQNVNATGELTQDKVKWEGQKRGPFMKRRRHLTPGLRVTSLIPQKFWEERGENKDEIAKETGSLQDDYKLNDEKHGRSGGSVDFALTDNEIQNSNKGPSNKSPEEESINYHYSNQDPHFKSRPQSLKLRRRSLSVSARFDQLLQNGKKDENEKE